jgi:hypothetical protein
VHRAYDMRQSCRQPGPQVVEDGRHVQQEMRRLYSGGTSPGAGGTSGSAGTACRSSLR